MPMLPHCPQDMPLWLRPHIPLTPPYNSSHLSNPLRRLPSSRSFCALPTCLQHHPHTGLILKMAYHPYAHALPSRYAFETTLTPPYASTPPRLNMLTLLLRP
ncbi:hypothetical protein O181_048782 [Austropuccinia psidii MF-1]|uniref:Uncharacterized protein n=1 Tax=Austropuccinia psidii MF-1 TaxID=1389203 RepID=A0A9Q3HLZ1_9BASI|nr:hypothetical protein [Austropuccinia psidii MF-1]